MRLPMKSLAMLAVVGSALASPAREARAALIIAFELVGPGGAPSSGNSPSTRTCRPPSPGIRKLTR